MKVNKNTFVEKKKNSKFFDYFLKTYGDSCTLSVNDDEIFKYLRNLYLDLAFGNLQDEKYHQLLRNDPRIINAIYRDCIQKCNELYIMSESLKFSHTMSCPICGLDLFEKVVRDTNTRYMTYSIFHKGIEGYLYTNDINYLLSIAFQFNNVMNRNLRQVLL